MAWGLLGSLVDRLSSHSSAGSLSRGGELQAQLLKQALLLFRRLFASSINVSPPSNIAAEPVRARFPDSRAHRASRGSVKRSRLSVQRQQQQLVFKAAFLSSDSCLCSHGLPHREKPRSQARCPQHCTSHSRQGHQLVTSLDTGTAIAAGKEKAAIPENSSQLLGSD